MFPGLRGISAQEAVRSKPRRTQGRRWKRPSFREERSEEERARRRKIRGIDETKTRSVDSSWDANGKRAVRKRRERNPTSRKDAIDRNPGGRRYLRSCSCVRKRTRVMHATAKMLAGNREKAERNARQVIVAENEIAERESYAISRAKKAELKAQTHQEESR